MNAVPRAFANRLTSHNRHVLFSAALSLAGAVLAWVVIYFGVRTLVLFLLTTIHGDAAKEPPHFFYFFAGTMVLLLTLAAVERAFNPFPAATDRPIIGWHLLKDLALLPALLTFAIYDNLNAYQRLTGGIIAGAWSLFQEIEARGKLSYYEVNLLEEEGPRTRALLLLLQFAGLLDLHQGQEEWFYLIPSSQREFCEQLKSESAN